MLEMSALFGVGLEINSPISPALLWAMVRGEPPLHALKWYGDKPMDVLSDVPAINTESLPFERIRSCVAQTNCWAREKSLRSSVRRVVRRSWKMRRLSVEQ